jgi:AcrR family transcriptional regulator
MCTTTSVVLAGMAKRVLSDTSPAPEPSLAEERSQLTRSRIRQAAMQVVAHHGFEATVLEIAELSGVSPRTIFRHYKSQSALIATTLQDMFEAGNRPIDGLPRPSDDLDGWLEGLTLALHARGVQIFGEVIWDLLLAPGAALPAMISEIIDAQVDFRRQAIQHFTTIAWQAAGGKGQAPDSLASAFTVQLSPFTTKTLMVEHDQTPAQVAALSTDVLKTLLQRAVDEQNRAQPDIAGAAGAGETEN